MSNLQIGISPPWYEDAIERMAFNLYAMEIEENNNDEESDECQQELTSM